MCSQNEPTSRLHSYKAVKWSSSSHRVVVYLRTWLDRAVAAITLVILAISLAKPSLQAGAKCSMFSCRSDPVLLTWARRRCLIKRFLGQHSQMETTKPQGLPGLELFMKAP